MLDCGSSRAFPTHNTESENTYTFPFMSLITSSSFTRDSLSQVEVPQLNSDTPEFSKFCSRINLVSHIEQFLYNSFLTCISYRSANSRSNIFQERWLRASMKSRIFPDRNLSFTLYLNEIDGAERILHSSFASKSVSVTEFLMTSRPVLALEFFYLVRIPCYGWLRASKRTCI